MIRLYAGPTLNYDGYGVGLQLIPRRDLTPECEMTWCALHLDLSVARSRWREDQGRFPWVLRFYAWSDADRIASRLAALQEQETGHGG